MATILIAEDDDNLRLLLEKRLSNRFNVITACNGIEALQMVEKQRIDLLITDILMPGMDGISLVKNLRSSGNKLPILMLTAVQSFEIKREGFFSGTDDYLTKPFEKDELLWRVDALLRRANIDRSKKIEIGPIKADLLRYSLMYQSKAIELSKKEFELFYTLLSEPGRIFTKKQLINAIWGEDMESSEDTLKTHISRLRGKIGEISEVSISAIKGIGYKLEVTV